jgi:hypothetical protein
MEIVNKKARTLLFPRKARIDKYRGSGVFNYREPLEIDEVAIDLNFAHRRGPGRSVRADGVCLPC